MFDTALTESGMGAIFKSIDYKSLSQSNVYYKSILVQGNIPSPAFFAGIDQDTPGKKTLKKMTTQKVHFLALRNAIKSTEASMPKDKLLMTFRNIGKTYPRDANLFLLFAQILLKREYYDDAKAFLQRCVQLDNKNYLAWTKLTLLSALAHDHGNTVYCARKALELKPTGSAMLAKAYVFTLMLLGAPAKVGPFDSTQLFNTKPFDYNELTRPVPTIDYVHVPEVLHIKPVVLFACDENYFNQYAKHIIRSLMQGSNDYNMHIHLVNPSANTIDWLKRYINTYKVTLIISKEEIDSDRLEDKSYLASCRFVVAPEFIKKFKHSYLIVDVDTILNSPDHLDSFFEQINRPTVHYSSGTIWDTATAAFVFMPNNKVGLSFGHKIQHFLLRMFFGEKRLSFWYIDQLALLASCMDHADHMCFAPARLVTCRRFSDDSIFWYLSNDKNVPKYWDACKRLEEAYPLD